MRLVLATANPHKASEIAAILGTTIELVARPSNVPEVIEDADTLESNARLKAVALCEATGEAAVADDSGLEVDALGGAPGVHSARYAGEQAIDADNVTKLLADLQSVAADQRTARFRTVALARFPNGTEVVAHGVVEGRIAPAATGTGGFGYDPVFIPDDPSAGGRTFAEMAPEGKHAISHRGRAFRSLADQLAAR